ncbi:MAG: HAD family hydrolase [Clostridia bacterium]|nr:HAD family hydrolase [Clostridia bacterium]
MKYKLVIFDLDGTVLDTLADLSNAVNAAMEKHSFPTHTIEEVRIMIGNSVANLIRRAIPEGASEDEYASTLAYFKSYYREHINVCTKPYPGVIDMLRSLKDAGIKVGINSNKFDTALQNLCRIHFPGLYDYAAGECETTPKKPDPTAAQRIMATEGVEPKDTIYIGDSNVDLDTAKNAGIDSAWVSWGFRREEDMAGIEIDRAFHSAEELKHFLLG